MPDIESISSERNATVLAKISEQLADLLKQGNVTAETNERVQQQLAAINDEDNLRPGERHFE